MKIHRFKTAGEVAAANTRMLAQILSGRKSLLRGFFPTGNSPKMTYSLMAKEKEKWAAKLDVIQIDEFLSPERLFFHQLKEIFLDPVEIKAFEGLDVNWTDAAMSTHIVEVLSRPIDVAFLGLGPNGHVGFHEPGVGGAPFMGGRVTISQATRQRVAGAQTNAVFTFGVGSFLKAEEILLTVIGEEKRSIFAAFESSPPTAEIPATLLKIHPKLTVTTDLR